MSNFPVDWITLVSHRWSAPVIDNGSSMSPISDVALGGEVTAARASERMWLLGIVAALAGEPDARRGPVYLSELIGERQADIMIEGDSDEDDGSFEDDPVLAGRYAELKMFSDDLDAMFPGVFKNTEQRRLASQDDTVTR